MSADPTLSPAFHTLFAASHGPLSQTTPGEQVEDGDTRIMHFRQSLLQLVVLLIARHVPHIDSTSQSALEQLRTRNSERAEAWRTRAEKSMIDVYPEAVLSWYASFRKARGTDGGEDLSATVNANHGRTARDAESDVPMNNTNASLSEPHEAALDANDQAPDPSASVQRKPQLLDLIPSFIRLTAQRAAPDPDWHTSPQWLHLAGNLMTQAVLEEFSSPNPLSSTPLAEAFAWGLEGFDREPKGESPQRDMNKLQEHTLFYLANESLDVHKSTAKPSTWAGMREKALDAFLPPSESRDGISSWHLTAEMHSEITRNHLEGMRRRMPLGGFERRLFSFLGDMGESYGRPVLTQLEDKSNDVTLDGETIGEEQADALRGLLRGR